MNKEQEEASNASKICVLVWRHVADCSECRKSLDYYPDRPDIPPTLKLWEFCPEAKAILMDLFN